MIWETNTTSPHCILIQLNRFALKTCHMYRCWLWKWALSHGGNCLVAKCLSLNIKMCIFQSESSVFRIFLRNLNTARAPSFKDRVDKWRSTRVQYKLLSNCSKCTSQLLVMLQWLASALPFSSLLCLTSPSADTSILSELRVRWLECESRAALLFLSFSCTEKTNKHIFT